MDYTMRDQLADCLDKLLAALSPDENPEVFVDRVAEEYLMVLVRQAHIPLRYLENMKEDVKLEVIDLLRVRSYGFNSLAEFLRSHAPSSRRSST